MSLADLKRFIRRLAREERGIITVQNLLLTVTCCAIGSIGLDVTHFYAARTELQVAADIGAHSALYLRYNGRSEADARAGAIARVEYSLPPDVYDTVLEPEDIVFGTWNAATEAFTPLVANDPTMPTAVQVTTNRAGDNPVGSFFFRIVGVDSMDVTARSTYSAVGDPCSPMQGLFGQGKVWVRSGNSAGAGVCFHSNDVVDTQNNNDFQYTPTDPLEDTCQSSAGHAILSMPDSSRLSNGTKNECINEAKRSATYDLSRYYSPLQGATTGPALLSQVDQVMQNMPAWSWSGINRTINTVTGTSLAASSSLTDRVNYVNCSGGNLTLSGTWTRTVLLLNDCHVKAQGDLVLSDTVLYNTNTDEKTSFNFGSGKNAAKMVIGNDTDCNGTGAAYVLTRGGFDAPAKLTLNNGTIIARGNVQFAAQFGGSDAPSRGLSIIAGGTIDGTSNGTFIPCPPPVDTPPRIVSFRLAG